MALDLDQPEGVRRVLDMLAASGVVSCYAEGPEAVYAIGADQHLAAAYYRNTIIHFFVTGAIAELALVRASEENVVDPGQEFWDEAMRVRDLLKFEFFFAEKEAFRRELRDELAVHDPQWEGHLAAGAPAIRALIRRIRPFNAHRILRPFLEAYRVVADALVRTDPAAPIDDGPFLITCLARGKQYQLQRRIHSPESVSKVLFEAALRLARNRDVVSGHGDLAAARRAFADELHQVIRRVDVIDALAASRRAGLSD
jgi:glycerol-3-phosphate O-acyltransferase